MGIVEKEETDWTKNKDIDFIRAKALEISADNENLKHGFLYLRQEVEGIVKQNVKIAMELIKANALLKEYEDQLNGTKPVQEVSKGEEQKEE